MCYASIRQRLLLGAAALTATLVLGAAATTRTAWAGDGRELSVNLEVFTPKNGDISGVGSRGTMVDLRAEFNGNLDSTGASLELTGPGVHANAAPLPGTFGVGANKDHFPGLIVLLSSTRVGAGPGQNVADLFNLTTITDRRPDRTQVWSTWIVGAPNAFGIAGERTPSRLFVAVVRGTAPDVVLDMDGNGVFDDKDLEAMGVQIISNIVERDFIVNGF